MADDTEDFASMLAAFEGEGSKSEKKRRPRVGDIIKGPIISIGKEAVFVDAGGKAEGVLDRSQVSDSDDKLLVALGDVVEARVVSDAGGVLTLRVKLGRGPQASAELQQAADFGIPVEGTVTEVIKGGVSVDVAGTRGFCPASQIDARFVDDLTVFVGQKLEFKITRYEPRNLVLSRRALIEEANAKRAEVLRTNLQPGLVVRGKVTGFKPFGAFVDIGGLEGMLHISELGFSRVDKPEDVLSLGQELEVVVLKIEQGADSKGRPQERISLSLKALADDPWTETIAGLNVGQTVKGKVSRLQPFGAFVELVGRPGIEGLVHISELGAGRRVNHPKEVVEVGQEVDATILQLDPERRRIGLSLAAASANEAGAAEVAEVTRTSASSSKLGTFGDLLAKITAKK